jgi:3-hydroxyisobutyrate dehydrogenase
MAMNILQAGYRVTAYNRSREKTPVLAEAGANILASPREVVAQSDIVFLMLSDASAIHAVLNGNSGVMAAMAPGKLVVNMSTIAPSDAVSFAQQVATAGGRYVDAPVSGSVGAAKTGQLIMLAGGEQEAVTACQPFFAVMGKETFHFGAAGMGSSAKLAINLLLGIMGQGIGEAVLFAEKSGVNKEKMLELISSSALNSPFFQIKKEMYRTDDFPAAFKVSLMAKDLGLVTAEAERIKTTLPLAEVAATTYCSARDHDKAELDMAAVYLELREQNAAGH